MSFWSELFVGEAESLSTAFVEGDLSPESPGVLAHLELPGILPADPGDHEDGLANSPDCITALASAHTGVSLSFESAKTMTILEDEDFGGYLMSQAWITLFANLQDRDLKPIAQVWAKEFGDTEFTGLEQLLREISALCTRAQPSPQSLLYTWTL